MNDTKLKILYEDNHLLVVEKPVNLPVQADASGDEDLLYRLKNYIKVKYNKPGEAYLGLVHRLDRPVGGVMVFARTSKAAARLAPQFGGHGAKKRYAALVCGTPEYSARLEDRLTRDADGTARISDAPEAKAAALDYTRIAAHGGLTLLDIELKTGRHHQIRVQLASRGLPVWGDQRYNPQAKPKEQIALWAYSLSFEHPVTKETLTFTSLPSKGAWEEFSLELGALCAGARVNWFDENILLIDKQTGLETAGEGDTLETRLNTVTTAYPVHRLDVNTTGLVLFARNRTAEAALTAAIRGRDIKKYYRCVVAGSPKPSASLLNYGVKDEKKARLYVYNTPGEGAQELKLAYRTLASRDGLSLLEAELITGRTHQIRAQLAQNALPLLGDDKYGDRELNRRYRRSLPALRAVRLELGSMPPPLEYLSARRFEGGIPVQFSEHGFYEVKP